MILQNLLLCKIFRDNTGNFGSREQVQVAYGHMSSRPNAIAFASLGDPEQIAYYSYADIRKLISRKAK